MSFHLFSQPYVFFETGLDDGAKDSRTGSEEDQEVEEDKKDIGVQVEKERQLSLKD